MTDDPPQIHELDKWMTLKAFTERFPQFSIQQLRWLLNQREANGLNSCVRKFGKYIYIHSDRFLEWFEK